MDRDQELALLTRQQKVDDTHIQRPEPHVVVSFDAFHNPELIFTFHDWDAEPCPIHGMTFLKRWGAVIECSECNKEKKLRLRRAKGIQPRRRGCARHGFKAWKVTPKGRAYCTIERRWTRSLKKAKALL